MKPWNIVMKVFCFAQFQQIFSSPSGLKMGNGSMKSKRYKPTDNSVPASNGQAHKDHCGVFKNSSQESLRVRVEELEREGKRKDEELCAKEQQIKGLQEQLAKQTRVLSELSEELQSKCIQLNKLQDVLKSGAPAGLASRPPSVKTSGKSSPNLSVRIKETLNRRKGAKAGVSAEPTSSTLPKFSFEKARVPKDARWDACVFREDDKWEEREEPDVSTGHPEAQSVSAQWAVCGRGSRQETIAAEINIFQVSSGKLLV